MQNHYAVLGLDSSVDEQTVKSEYRKLVKLCHPDRNPGDPKAASRFHELTTAYDAIINKKPTFTPRGTLMTTASLRQVYFGFNAVYEEKVFGFKPGFKDGDIYTFQYDEHTTVDVSVTLLDYPGFRREGLDLHTEMTIRQNDIDRQSSIAVPNHPNIWSRMVIFPKYTKTGMVLTSIGLGLVQQNGPPGDLHITVTVLPNKNRVSRFPWFTILIVVLIVWVIGGW